MNQAVGRRNQTVNQAVGRGTMQRAVGRRNYSACRINHAVGKGIKQRTRGNQAVDRGNQAVFKRS